MPNDKDTPKPPANAVRCGDLVCDGVEAGTRRCPDCIDGPRLAGVRYHPDWPAVRKWVECKTCRGTGRVRVMPARSHTDKDLARRALDSE